MGVTGVKAVIFVMAMVVTTATAGKAAIIVKAGKAATSATIVITGAKDPLPIVRTVTSPQVGASLTVRPVPRTATVRSVMIAHRGMTAMARAGGLRVRRAMTGRAAMTAMIAQTVQIGPIVQTVQIVQIVRIGMVARTGRTETAVATRTVALGVGGMEARAVAPVVAPAVIKTAAERAARTNALVLAAASPNGPEIPLTVPYLRQWCGF